MKVALFAPGLTRKTGGLWQFYKWAANHLQDAASLHLVAPSDLLAEINSAGLCNHCCSETDANSIEEKVRATLLGRILEREEYPRLLGMRPPYYFTMCNWIKKNLCHGGCIQSALYGDLRQNRIDLVHVPQQATQYSGAIRKLPYVINPHDYQHEHYPEYFTNEQIRRRREISYPFQRKAGAIIVHSIQTREDAIRYLGIPEEKIFYAPYGPLNTFPVPGAVEIQETKKVLSLPEKFIFYPARLWQHKNHVALVDAIAMLKKKGEKVDCVFTDNDTEYSKVVHERIKTLGVEDQIHFLGRIDARQMGAVYNLCTMVVVPSLFEQNSGPMLEAIHLGKPVAVSNLPELVNSLDNAGLIFDGKSAVEIAGAIEYVWSSDENKSKLEELARKRRSEMSWIPFVEIYKQAYSYALDTYC